MTSRKAFVLHALEAAHAKTLLRGEVFDMAAQARSFNAFDYSLESFERSFRRTLNGAIGPARSAAFFQQAARGLPIGILIRLLEISRRLAGYIPSPRIPEHLAYCVDPYYAVPILLEGDSPVCVLPPMRLGVGRAPPFLTLRERVTEQDIHAHCHVDVRLFGHIDGRELRPVDPTMFSGDLSPLPEHATVNGVRIAIFAEQNRARLLREGVRPVLP